MVKLRVVVPALGTRVLESYLYDGPRPFSKVCSDCSDDWRANAASETRFDLVRLQQFTAEGLEMEARNSYLLQTQSTPLICAISSFFILHFHLFHYVYLYFYFISIIYTLAFFLECSLFPPG